MKFLTFPCPNCQNKTHLTREEAIKEKYIFCWLCGEDFKNPNYVKEKKR